MKILIDLAILVAVMPITWVITLVWALGKFEPKETK